MSAYAQAQVEPAPRLSFTPVRSGLLQRRCACGGTLGVDGECAECRRKRLTAQRFTLNEAEPEASEVAPVVREVLNSPGQPLDPAARAFMEPRFGHDFGKVRVHNDVKAAESARAVNALAYTIGSHVVFDSGRYEPQTRRGRLLLAHELTHTIQQDMVHLPPGKIVVAPHHEPSEIEARRTANALSLVSMSQEAKPAAQVTIHRPPEVARQEQSTAMTPAAMAPAATSAPGSGLSSIVAGGLVGSIQPCLDLCTGDIVSVDGWIWVGAGYAGPVWVGPYWYVEGDLLPEGHKTLHVLDAPLTCGTCDPNCAPPPKEGGETGIKSGISLWPAVFGERKFKGVGIEVGILPKPHSFCDGEVEVIILIDLFQLIPQVRAANAFLEKLPIKVEVQGGIDFSGNFRLCRATNGGWTVPSAKLCGGGFLAATVGGLPHDKTKLPH